MSVCFPTANTICKELRNCKIYSPFLSPVGGFVITRGILTGPFNYDEPNGYLRTHLDVFGLKGDQGRGLVALHSV